MVSANESIEALLQEAEQHINGRQNADVIREETKESAEEEPADAEALAMLSSLTEKLAQLEQNTSELDADTLSLTAQLLEEEEDFKASRVRAQEKIDQFRELDSDVTRYLPAATWPLHLSHTHTPVRAFTRL